MKRQHFLQLAASTLATVGINTWRLKDQSIQYAKVLARPTQRKRALLVGINKYPDSRLFTKLRGCVTDVELQRELLIHRFGFHPDDIETLTDTEASRNRILETFEEFLIKPCQEEDVVVFHYSGHGRRIADPDNPVLTERGTIDSLNSTLVPSDDSVIAEGGAVSDIMGRTLFLLTSALKTENVTMVLDSCYAGGGIRGNTRVRSLGQHVDLQPSDEELEFQERWLRDPTIGASRDDILQRRSIGIAKGIAIASARRNQKAVDASFDGFHAGAFTYFLTQFLWHEAESVERVIANVTRNLETEQFNQVPLGCVAPLECDATQRRSQPLPIYHLEAQETDRAPAEAVILGVSGDRATIWLGGSDANSLITYREGATFHPAGASDHEPITIIQRTGLTAEVSLPTNLPEGTLLQESARIVPRNTTLRIGLDPSLAESLIGDTSTAHTAFTDMGDRFEFLMPNDDGDYEGEVHYILSRITEEYRQFLQESEENQPIPEANTIVLLSSGIDQVVPGSVQDNDSLSIDTIITHLQSTLNALYAARLIKLAINADAPQQNISSSQRLRVDVQIELLQNGESIGAPVTMNGVMEIPLDMTFRFVVTNQDSDPIYLSILEVDQAGDVTPLFPNQLIGSVDETLIEPNQTKQIPEPTSPYEFFIENPIRAEFLIMVSRRSPRQALIALRNDQRTSNVPVVDALLADIAGVELNRSTAQQLSISTSTFAAFSIPFRVV